eukprot:m.75460 g.75460  ORF g.75460 m.75460 type:complete len:149 (+) comp14482_c0_seq3:1607-2053(+)
MIKGLSFRLDWTRPSQQAVTTTKSTRFEYCLSPVSIQGLFASGGLMIARCITPHEAREAINLQVNNVWTTYFHGVALTRVLFGVDTLTFCHDHNTTSPPQHHNMTLSHHPPHRHTATPPHHLHAHHTYNTYNTDNTYNTYNTNNITPH